MHVNYYQNHSYVISDQELNNREKTATENRHKAVSIMFRRVYNKEGRLYLSGLIPKSLPGNLSGMITELCMCKNKLNWLPKNLPESLLHINASDNNLSNLSVHLPPNLLSLQISGNKINRISCKLPDSLYLLDVSDNPLSEITEDLPDGLNTLIVSCCALNNLPEKIPAHLETLIADNNEIKQYPNITYKSLTWVDISFNKVSHLSNVYRDMCQDGYFTILGNPITKRQTYESGNMDNVGKYNGIFVRWPDPVYRDYDARNIERALTRPDKVNTLNKWREIMRQEDEKKNAPDYNNQYLKIWAFLDFIERFQSVFNKETCSSMHYHMETAIIIASENKKFRKLLFSSAHKTMTQCYDKLAHGYIDVLRLLISYRIDEGFISKRDIMNLFTEVTNLNILMLCADMAFSNKESLWKHVIPGEGTTGATDVASKIIKNKNLLINRNTLFVFLCNYLCFPIGEVTKYEQETLSKNIDLGKVDSLLDEVIKSPINALTTSKIDKIAHTLANKKDKSDSHFFQNSFYSSALLSEFAKKHYPKIYSKVNDAKYDALESFGNISRKRKLEEGNEISNPLSYDRGLEIDAEINSDIGLYYGARLFDKIHKHISKKAKYDNDTNVADMSLECITIHFGVI